MIRRIVSLLLACIILTALIGVLQATADTEANKAISRRNFEELWSQGDLSVVDEIIAPYYVRHDPGNPAPGGPEGLKQVVTGYQLAIPDINFAVEDMVAEGDMVATRWTATGTQTGTLMTNPPIPPTGKYATVTGISIHHIIDGKIVRDWAEWDTAGFMQQLGVVPGGREDYSWGQPSEATGDPGTAERNKATVMRYAEVVWNQQRLDVLDEISSPDVLVHIPSNPVPVYMGIEASKQTISAYLAGLPDLHVTINHILAEGDKVAFHWTVKGTHQGVLAGISPSGNQVTFTGITISRFVDGKMAEAWWAWSGLGLMRQLTATPEKDYTNVFFMELAEGLNMISMPLEPSIPHTARSFVEEIGATIVIKYDTTLGRFKGFAPNGPGEGFPILGGEGYIVNVPRGGAMVCTGAAWINEPPVAAAPPISRRDAWAFVVTGSVSDGVSASCGDYTIVVKNLRTGGTFTEMIDSTGHFAVASADLTRKAIVKAGDELEVSVVDSNGELASGPFVHKVTLEQIRDAMLDVRLRIGHIIPGKSALLQNYPNPFNPETWIPYQLKDADSVYIRIHDASGRLIRTLDLGYKGTGVYASRSKAAYWDGKNEAGEEVASGVYFYSISVGDFSATRKMTVRK